MDAEVSTLTTMPPVILNIEADDPSSSLDIKEPTVNGIPHKLLEEEHADSSTAKACDSSAENIEILTFKVDSVPATNKTSGSEVQEKMNFSDEEPLPMVVEKNSKNQEKEWDDKNLEKDDDEEMLEDEEEGEDDDNSAEKRHASAQQRRPKRDVQRRSVFEMLQSEIHDDEDELDKVDNDKGGNAKARKKRKNSDEELNLDEVNDDDDDDEDFTADGNQRKSPTKKKPASAKKEQKTLVLFDDDDLPLKGKRSGGRPKKKKLEDEDMPSEDDWQMAGRIKGKLFHDDEDDHENDIYDFSYRQQTSSEKKILTSNKRSFDGSTKKQSCSKKIKIDVQGWKFSKSRDGMESKPKSRSSSGPFAHHQTSGHHSSGASSNVSALRHSNEITRTDSLHDDEMRRKNSIMALWEQKLRHFDMELEERVAIVRRNEGKILREERRLREYEAVLGYREKLLNNCEEIVHGGSEDAAEKLSCMKRDYEKYRRLAEDHQTWIDREHHKIEAHALGKSYNEVDESKSQEAKRVTDDLPSLEQVEEGDAQQSPPVEVAEDSKAAQEPIENADHVKKEE